MYAKMKYPIEHSHSGFKYTTGFKMHNFSLVTIKIWVPIYMLFHELIISSISCFREFKIQNLVFGALRKTKIG